MPEFIALYIVIFLFSVIIHEVMHGVVALKFGDNTAQRAGRLTLNPIPHIDPIGTILLPGLMFLSASQGLVFPFFIGWAKPVPVNPLNFSNIRKGELWVSAAGVLANLGFALVLTLIFHFVKGFDIDPNIIFFLFAVINLNLILGIFNLFPIPPLDGSKILMTLLPYNLAKEYQKLEQYGFLILIICLMIPFGNSTLLQTFLSFILNIVRGILGLN